MKKTLSLILAVLMVSSCMVALPVTTSAEVYSGECGTNVTWSLDMSTGVLIISGAGEMNENQWNEYRDEIKTVIIGDEVTSICPYAFYRCENLTSVTIGNGVTSIKSSAFRDCTSLVSITIPNSVTSIGERILSGCSSLESIVLPFVGDSVKTESDTYQYPLGYIFGTSSYAGGKPVAQYYYGSQTTSTVYTAFYIPSSLKSVTITGGNILYGAFWGCKQIINLTISNSVTSIGDYAFYDCTNIENVYYTGSLSEWCNISFNDSAANPLHFGANLYINDTLLENAVIPDTVTSINEYTFSGCESIKTVTIPNSVTKIVEGAFSDCTSLTNVTIGQSVTSIDGTAFYNCTNIKNVYYTGNLAEWCNISFNGSAANPLCFGASLYISDTLLENAVIPDTVMSIKDDAFDGCKSLKTVTIPDSVTSIAFSAFNRCANLINITVDENNPNYCSFDGILYDKFKTTLIQAPRAITEFDNIPNSVTSIGDCAFSQCDNLTSVTIGGNVTSIGDYAFDSCASLTNVTIGNNVTSIGDFAFYSCHSLMSITIGDSVKSIGENTFSFCESLTSITIPDSVTDIGDDAFSFCKNLTNVTIGTGVKDIGWGAFYHCSAIDDVYYTGDLEGWCNIGVSQSFESNPLYYGANLYIDGNLLTDAMIPNTALSIAPNAFYGCESIKTAVIPSDITYINNYAFSNCVNLTNVTILDGVTGIGMDAFSGCTSLVSITIPDSITDIAPFAFAGCTSLKNITIPKSVTIIGDDPFYGCSGLEAIFLYRDSYADTFFSADPELAPKIVYIADSLTLTVDSVRAIAGETIAVDIVMSNNPGVAGISFFVEYDRSVMTLIGYSYANWEGTTNFDQDTSHNPVGFFWQRPGNYSKNGTILSLTFEIKEDAPLGEYDLVLLSKFGIANEDIENIEYNLVNGTITISDYIPGDLNGDGDINSIDAVLLAQKIAGWDVDLDEMAADCNGDGEINSIDAVLLAQFIAGWDVTLG